MYEYAFLLPISLFLFMGVISPGPSFILVAHTAATQSKSDAIAVSVGMGMGATIFAVVASLGLFIVLETVPWVYFLLKTLGGIYLLFLAFKMWKNAGKPLSEHQALNKRDNGTMKLLLLGLVTQLSNPKTAIVFGSAFAAFLPKEVPEYAYQLISILAFLIDTGWYVLVVFLFSTAKVREAYATSKQMIGRLASGVLGLIGAKLLIVD